VTYARGTSVPVERSKAHLDALLGRAGASSRGIMSDDDGGQVAVVFRLAGQSYRLLVPLPRRDAIPAKGREPRGWHAWTVEKREHWRSTEWEQACRERWRLVVLLVKTKLEMVALGASTAQREFMADLVLANGKTIQEVVAGDGARLLLGDGTAG